MIPDLVNNLKSSGFGLDLNIFPIIWIGYGLFKMDCLKITLAEINAPVGSQEVVGHTFD